MALHSILSTKRQRPSVVPCLVHYTIIRVAFRIRLLASNPPNRQNIPVSCSFERGKGYCPSRRLSQLSISLPELWIKAQQKEKNTITRCINRREQNKPTRQDAMMERARSRDRHVIYFLKTQTNDFRREIYNIYIYIFIYLCKVLLIFTVLLATCKRNGVNHGVVG